MSERDRDRRDGLPHQLVRRAARCAPAQLAERLEEEWLADLLCRTGHLSRYRFAVGCWWAAHLIAHEHGCAHAGASATASANRSASLVLARYDWPFLSRRTLALLSILALHVLLIYGLASGLARKIVTVITQPLQVTYVATRPRDAPPPPALPSPTLLHPRLDIPPTELKLNLAPEQSAIDVPALRPQVQPVVPSHPTLPVSRVVGGPGRGFPNTDDYYPTASRRLEETGSSVVRVCVDDRGRLANLPAILQSSGSVRLDEGAIRLARAGSGHYRPTTEDGRPVPSCYAFRITFTLKE
jgi:periplasmic protein TonB